MMAGVLLNFGEAGEAAKLLGHAQALLDRAGDRTSIERARLLRWQGVMAMITQARPPWAEHPLRLAIELLRARYADDDELLSALASLPSLACDYGEAGEAMAGADELHRRTLARYGDDNLFVDEADEMRGQLMALNGRAADALPVLERALEGFRRHVGAKSPNLVQAQLGLATAYQAAGRADASQRAYEAARQAIEHDHADDKRLAQQIASTREDIDKLRSGQTLRCKR
jgi:tetratricopeptide (TPR) repeat protein